MYLVILYLSKTYWVFSRPY